MFYSHQLLARKAPLGQIWMAATLHAKINRKKLDKLDIIQICEEILNPSVPMVFRLSGISMGGVVIVYERKVKLLFDDGTRLLVEINGAWRTKAVPDPTLLLKGKTQARKKAVTLPENEEADFGDVEQTRNLPKFPSFMEFQQTYISMTTLPPRPRRPTRLCASFDDQITDLDIEASKEQSEIQECRGQKREAEKNLESKMRRLKKQRTQLEQDLTRKELEMQDLKNSVAVETKASPTSSVDELHLEIMKSREEISEKESLLEKLEGSLTEAELKANELEASLENLYVQASKQHSCLEWISEIYGEEKKKKILPTGKGAGKGEGSSLNKSQSSNDLYNLVCFSRKYSGQIVCVDDKGDGYKRLDEPNVNDNHEHEDLGQQFHQDFYPDADNITLFEYLGSHRTDAETYDRFERFDIQGDDETQINFSAREGAQTPTLCTFITSSGGGGKSSHTYTGVISSADNTGGISGAGKTEGGSSGSSRQGKGVEGISQGDEGGDEGDEGGDDGGGWVKKKSRQAVRESKKVDDSPVYIDLETVEFQHGFNVRRDLKSNIYAAFGKYASTVFVFSLQGDERTEISILRNVRGVNVSRYHRRHMVCPTCVQEPKRGDLLEITLVDAICQHALDIQKKHLGTSSIGIVSGDPFFTQTVVTTLRYCGIAAHSIMPAGLSKRRMTDQPTMTEPTEPILSVNSQRASSSSVKVPVIWDFGNAWVSDGVDLGTLKARIEMFLQSKDRRLSVGDFYAVGPPTGDKATEIIGLPSDFKFIGIPGIGKKCGSCHNNILHSYRKVLLMRTTDIADKYAVLLIYKMALLNMDDALVISGDCDLVPAVDHVKDNCRMNIRVAKPRKNSHGGLKGNETYTWEDIQLPGTILAPEDGMVERVLVKNGQSVVKGVSLLVLKADKTVNKHIMKALSSGTIYGLTTEVKVSRASVLCKIQGY